MALVLGRNVDRSHNGLEHRIRLIKMPEHPSTIRLIAYWQECNARGGMRMGRDMPARAIAPLLKDLTVSEPVGDWADARIRLAGSAMTAYFGRDVRGALMSEISGSCKRDNDMLLAGAKAAIAHNCPGTVEQIIADEGIDILRQELTALPIYAPEGDVRWILVGTFNF